MTSEIKSDKMSKEQKIQMIADLLKANSGKVSVQQLLDAFGSGRRLRRAIFFARKKLKIEAMIEDRKTVGYQQLPGGRRANTAPKTAKSSPKPVANNAPKSSAKPEDGGTGPVVEAKAA